MMDSKRVGLLVVAIAAAIAVLGDLLLRGVPWGANVTLFSLVLLAVMVLSATWSGCGLVGGWGWLLGVLIPLSFCFLWRDSLALLTLNVVAMTGGLALVYSRTPRGDLRVAGIVDVFHALLVTAVHASAGVIFLIRNDVEWRSWQGVKSSARFIPTLRGVLLAVPISLLFLALLMSADAAFETMVRKVFDIDIAVLVEHSLVIGFLGWIVAGFLRGRLIAREVVVSQTSGRLIPFLGIQETGIVLGAINVIFLTFILVQFEYLFGGSAFVKETTGVTFAEYARRGFFELVAVAGLSMLLLLTADWALNKEKRKSVIVFRTLAGAQVLLVLAVMVSAIHRLVLYKAEFGLTEARVYAMGCLIWLLLVFIWFGWTVLRGRRERFAFGALIGAYGILLALNAVNPDRVIAAVNIARAGEGKHFDAHYAASLSGDALPLLVDELPRLFPADRSVIARRLIQRFAGSQPFDLRSWNIARHEAIQAFIAHQRELREAAVNLVEGPR